MRPMHFKDVTIFVEWETMPVHDHREILLEELKPGDMWDYDVYWQIPSYAPTGTYTVEVTIRGHFDEDQDDHFETLTNKSGDAIYKGKHKVYREEDLPQDPLACFFLTFELER